MYEAARALCRLPQVGAAVIAPAVGGNMRV